MGGMAAGKWEAKGSRLGGQEAGGGEHEHSAAVRPFLFIRYGTPPPMRH